VLTGCLVRWLGISWRARGVSGDGLLHCLYSISVSAFSRDQQPQYYLLVVLLECLG